MTQVEHGRLCEEALAALRYVQDLLRARHVQACSAVLAESAGLLDGPEARTTTAEQAMLAADLSAAQDIARLLHTASEAPESIDPRQILTCVLLWCQTVVCQTAVGDGEEQPR